MLGMLSLMAIMFITTITRYATTVLMAEPITFISGIPARK